MHSIEPRIPDVSTLRRIDAIGGLSEGHLIAIANRLQLFDARPGEVLLDFDSTDSKSLYVVTGKVSLRARDGRVKFVSVGHNDPIDPIAQLRPSVYRITAINHVTYLRIDRQTLIDYAELSAADADDISVHSLFSDDDATDCSVINQLYRNLMNNEIKLPSLPSVAARVQRIYQGEDTDVDALCHVLVNYPDVAQKLDNVARCAKRDDLNALHKLRLAIDRLGLQPTYCLVMTYGVGKLVNRLSRKHMLRVSSFWEHSVNVSAIARILSRKRKPFPPDRAMLAGLVHGIGVLVIDDKLLEHRHLMLDHLEIDHAIQAMRPEISSLLLRKWDFEDDLIEMAEECGDWSRSHDGPPDLSDLVLVANYYALLHSDVDHVLPRADAIPAIEALGVTADESIAAIREAPRVGHNIRKLFR